MTLLDDAPPALEPGPALPAPASSVAARVSAARRVPSGAATVAVVVAVLPLVSDPAGWYVYLSARWFVVVVAVLVGMIGLAATGKLRAPAGAGWWMALVGVASVSAIASAAPGVSLFGANDRLGGAATWLVHGCVAAVGASVVRRRGDLRRLARGVSFAAVFVTVIVAAQRLGWRYPAGAVAVGRPGGPFGNAGFLGAFAVLAALVAVGAAADADEGDGWRLVHAVGATGAAWCLVLSGTRGAWIGFVAGGVVLTALAIRRRGISARRIVGAVALVAIALAGLGMLAGLGDRLADVDGGTAAGRVSVWEHTIDVIAERPVLGWGPEGFAEGFGRSVDDAWERTYSRRLTPDRAHNGLLDVGVAMGLVGLVAYAGLMLSTGRAALRSVRSGPSTGMVTAGIVAALVAYVVQQQFLFQLFDVDAVAWLLAGALAGSIGGSGGGRPTVAPRWRSHTSVVTAAVVGLTVTAVVAGSGVLADRSARRSIDARAAGSTESAVTAANVALDRSSNTLYGLVLADAALADGSEAALRESRARLGTLRARTFDDGRLTLARSRLARADGRLDGLAESELEVAMLLEVDQSRSDGWLELGDVELQLGEDGGGATRVRAGDGACPPPRCRVAWIDGRCRPCRRPRFRPAGGDSPHTR